MEKWYYRERGMRKDVGNNPGQRSGPSEVVTVLARIEFRYSVVVEGNHPKLLLVDVYDNVFNMSFYKVCLSSPRIRDSTQTRFSRNAETQTTYITDELN